MANFYWFLLIYIVSIVALGEVSVTSKNAKIRDQLEGTNHEPLLNATFKKISKTSINPEENFKNRNGNVTSTDRTVHRGNRKWRAARKKNSLRPHVEKRRRKDVLSKTIDNNNKEMDYTVLKNEGTLASDVTQSDQEIPMELITKENYLSDHRISVNQMPVSLSRELDNDNFTEIPWPVIPGPITCELGWRRKCALEGLMFHVNINDSCGSVDYQLQPSFVAKLGEFDYVVSVERQENPDEPPEHICTGVIYNRRFVVITPHCLEDNYGLSVTSTDDLCTIDEMIDVDYIIEHKNYDPETKKNDIALIKLKSEIHKRHANFANEDEALGTYFFAVGFGELMWKSFPTKVSKLLQKVPVVRYAKGRKELPNTLHVTASHMDLTGSFRGDYGGALVNPRGEFVGLKSKFVKRSTEYEVYTRVRDYLPWIKTMVALHGS